ncbi:MAG: folate-binding protein, partial [Paracoccaceae bacterium]|nr:folate-binding protein [Paracoccaceae bacterium]
MNKSRTIIKVGGEDALDFLQGLVTNDVSKAENALVYAALLTPQGKYLVDFFIFQSRNSWFLDVNSLLADELVKQLTFYR